MGTSTSKSEAYQKLHFVWIKEQNSFSQSWDWLRAAAQWKKRLLYNLVYVAFEIYSKALTKYERPKMKRDARQKCSLFLRNLYFVAALAKILVYL